MYWKIPLPDIIGNGYGSALKIRVFTVCHFRSIMRPINMVIFWNKMWGNWKKKLRRTTRSTGFISILRHWNLNYQYSKSHKNSRWVVHPQNAKTPLIIFVEITTTVLLCPSPHVVIILRYIILTEKIFYDISNKNN